MKWLIYGHKGWIGSYIVDILNKQKETVILGCARVNNYDDVEKEIKETTPDRIITTTGRTSGGNFTTIDYLEQKGKLVENVRDNLQGPLTLAKLSEKYGIHLTYMGTGCIFNGYPKSGYTEDDIPDFFGSSYSSVKGITDVLMKQYKTVLNVRIRMPITDDDNPKNFINKIMKYEKICNMANSMTVLPELLPIMIDMAVNKQTGTINLTNPGMISHNEILEMVQKYKTDFVWKNFTLEEQAKILLSERSNNFLNTDKLQSLYPDVRNIHDAVAGVVGRLFNK
jgi:3,5-epimerase/4-reductase